VLDIEKRLFEWSNSMLISSGRTKACEIKPLRQEASTRKYYRLISKDESHIGVFSSPTSELNEQFIFLSEFFTKQGVAVPEVLFSDMENGWMLLEDFGDNSYQFKLNKKNFHHLFSAAFDEMISIHSCPLNSNIPFLEVDDLKNQMLLFEKWFLQGLLEIKLSREEDKLFSCLYKEILGDLTIQPYVLCHFDFESRNLMLLENGNTGVLDFQDAVFGPIFLDPAALIKDLYLDLTEQEESNLFEEYITRANELPNVRLNIEDSKRSFDLTGLQRQLRILGVLSRLHLRDGKSFRLSDLNKTLNFVIETCNHYKELKEVSYYLKQKVVPLLTLTLKKIL